MPLSVQRGRIDDGTMALMSPTSEDLVETARRIAASVAADAAAAEAAADAEAAERQAADDALFNEKVAKLFRRAAELLDQQDADLFRVRAYEAGARYLERLREPASAIYRREGLDGLIALPTIGQALARAIADIVDTGRWHWLDRLEGTIDPERVFASVGGIGPVLADRIHDELGVECLQELEEAANDGRLATVEGFGPKRVRAIAETLDSRLRYRSGRTRPRHIETDPPSAPAAPGPSEAELLDVDEEYRTKARAGLLKVISPKRFNPTGDTWLPILHTTRGDRHYTVLFSNSARAHALGQAHDWVVIYAESPDTGTWTVVTETHGPKAGHRVVRGLT